jgi:23S rRNA (pseudouridine1915-N3)-methyltransferase
MLLKLIYVSRKDEPWVEDAVTHYVKRIKRYTALQLQAITPPKGTRGLNAAEFRKRESAAIEPVLPGRHQTILLDKRGKSLSTENLASLLSQAQSGAQKEIAFVIGGAYGFTEDLLKKANMVISLSAMTFPHQLARLILVEQLYRAFTILRGEAYHHA